MIEILKHSIELVKNEKRDVEVIMEIQKQKYEKRETELLTTIKVSTLINIVCYLCCDCVYYYYRL